MMARDASENAADSGNESWTMICVLLAPGAIGGIPASTRQLCGAINAVPVRGIILGKLLEAPRNAHFTKHCEIGGRIGGIGVEECAIPIEEHTLECVVVTCRHCVEKISRSEMKRGAPETPLFKFKNGLRSY